MLLSRCQSSLYSMIENERRVVNRRFAALLLCASLPAVACSSVDLADCVISKPLSGELERVPKLDDLQESLSVVIEAHCLCEFSGEARSRMPLGVHGRGSWSEAGTTCLGPTRIVQWTIEGDGLLAIEIVKKGQSPRIRSNRYVLFAHLVDGRWLYSWPEGTGPPLHPRSI